MSYLHISNRLGVDRLVASVALDSCSSHLLMVWCSGFFLPAVSINPETAPIILPRCGSRNST